MKKALIGNGGHAKEVMSQMGMNLTCFVDDEYLSEGSSPLSSFDPKKYSLMIAVSDPKDRWEISQRLPKETVFFTFVHPSALIFGDVEIGRGSFIGANSILTTSIKIGNHSILNRGNQIGHECSIGNYFSAMPGSIVSGNVTIGDLVYLGSNSSIREGLNISGLVKIGLNSGVVKDIKSPGIYGGVPARRIR